MKETNFKKVLCVGQLLVLAVAVSVLLIFSGCSGGGGSPAQNSVVIPPSESEAEISIAVDFEQVDNAMKQYYKKTSNTPILVEAEYVNVTITVEGGHILSDKLDRQQNKKTFKVPAKKKLYILCLAYRKNETKEFASGNAEVELQPGEKKQVKIVLKRIEETGELEIVVVDDDKNNNDTNTGNNNNNNNGGNDGGNVSNTSTGTVWVATVSGLLKISPDGRSVLASYNLNQIINCLSFLGEDKIAICFAALSEQVKIYNKDDLSLVKSFNTKTNPTSIRMLQDGTLLMATFWGVSNYTRDGTENWFMSGYVNGKSFFNSPRDVVQLSNGNFIVADNKKLVDVDLRNRFDPILVRTYPEFNESIVNIQAIEDGKVLAADTTTIKEFDANGNPVLTITKNELPLSDDRKQKCRFSYVQKTKDGGYLITDSGANAVFKINSQKELIWYVDPELLKFKIVRMAKEEE